MTSEQFCKGQDFTAGLLRHWACRLGNRVRQRRTKPEVRLARVVRVEGGEEEQISEGGTAMPRALTIEVGRARVSVGPGFSRAMLAAVIGVLAGVAWGGR